MQRRNGLQEKRVVVLGGSSGIGLAVAEQAALQGASVIIASSSAERVRKGVESIGGEAQGQTVDVSDERAVATFFSKLGTFDHLVFTATACICTTLPLRISNRPDAPLSCVIGRHSPRSNTEAPIFARRALSCSQQESLASARKRDG
jgi:NAD(P)-dependent dehydrogenase (short-subunit alcohol dehydrogenase family)